MTRSIARTLPLLALLLGISATLLSAQTVTAVVDAASNTADVSPGALATIYGSDLSSYGDGTVVIDGVSAPLLYVSPTQINFQVPYETQPGTATAVVYTAGYKSNPFPFDVYQAAPGIFVDENQNSISQNADGSLNDQNNPAAPGSVVVVYLTGIGTLDYPVGTGQPAGSNPLSRAVLDYTATIGGQAVQIDYLGLTPGFIGLAQANLVMPNLQDGDYPLVITIGGNASNSPFIAIAANGAYVKPLPKRTTARPRKR